MQLTEPIESINRQLVDHFGIDTSSGQPMFRIVWAPDQFDKRLTHYTDGGILLLHPEVRLLPKYRQWIGEKWILERLVANLNNLELGTEKQSYECIWTFQDRNDNYLPPRFDAAKAVVDILYAAEGKKSLRHYIENEDNIETRHARVEKLYAELFGNETPAGDALAYGSGIAVPHNYTAQNEGEKS